MPIRILVVDDSAIFRQGLRAMLEEQPDWEVCGEAVDGLDGIEKNRVLTPHLIIMDLTMPRMAGLQAACEIFKEFPKVPIVLLTLYHNGQLDEDARKVGIRATFSKTAMNRLVDGIRTILRGKDFHSEVGFREQ